MQIKVKAFESTSLIQLEEDINHFMETILYAWHLKDIKYQHRQPDHYSAMVIYQETLI